jgi:hypothetical protein
MPYYINAPTLSSATAVYDDPQLTICSANGYYAEGPVVRQQIDCVLLPEQQCPFCGVECGFTVIGPVNKGVYYFSVELGFSTGPVEIRFDPKDYPNGIQVVYDSTVYNSVISPLFGVLSAPTSLPVFVGDETEDCGIVGTHTLQEFEYIGADSSFHNLGTTEVVNVLASQSQLTWSSPGSCVMIIPKPNATPSSLVIKAISPCDLDSFSISVSCPGDGDVFEVDGSEGGPEELICGYPSVGISYYLIPVNGDGTTLGLYDMLYNEPDCTTPLADNYYLSSACPAPNAWFRVENGIIVEFGECDSTFKYDVQVCGNTSAPTFVVLSPFTLTLGNTVSLSDPIYEGCRFEVISVAAVESTPIALVVEESTDSCENSCVYYKVYNEDMKPAIVNYTDCEKDPQTVTIPFHAFVYICAMVDTITSAQEIEIGFEDCQCPS